MRCRRLVNGVGLHYMRFFFVPPPKTALASRHGRKEFSKFQLLMKKERKCEGWVKTGSLRAPRRTRCVNAALMLILHRVKEHYEYNRLCRSADFLCDARHHRHANLSLIAWMAKRFALVSHIGHCHLQRIGVRHGRRSVGHHQAQRLHQAAAFVALP